MSRRKKSLDTLEALLKATNTKVEFNIVEDLESLVNTYGVIKSRDFKKKLNAILEKYKTSELTAVRNTVLNESIKGNMQAVRLYAEYFKPAEAVTEDDGLVAALNNASKDVFANNG